MYFSVHISAQVESECEHGDKPGRKEVLGVFCPTPGAHPWPQ